MDLQIKGHVAIVQGASRGIGHGIADSLAAEGCNLLISARNETSLKDAARDLATRHGVRVEAIAGDSADPGLNQQLVDAAREKFGRLDILVCNSGGPPAGTFKTLGPDAWSAAANLIVVAPVDLLRRSLDLLAASPAPRFFVVTSSSTRVAIDGLTLSNVYRPAVVGLVKSLSSDLAAEGICCHSIAPGRIDTDRLRHLADVTSERTGQTPEEVLEGMRKATPAGRLGTPVDLGSLVAYLSSPAAEFLNGGNWLVDGGFVRAL
ncbi:MAG: SDR family oxidoreductase [Candidatus Sumerlaeia bacterium]|nr:SDR family oxidoreductase [Candidatus Sumerlaeia bacterium]